MKNSILNMTYPWFLGLFVLFLSLYLPIGPDMSGYENILESLIQFSGLIIGFYTSMYGIVLVAGNLLLTKFEENRVEKVFKNNLIQSLTSAFAIYIFSVIMQELRYHKNVLFLLGENQIKVNYVGFYIWIFSAGVFLGMSYRSIRLLLKMLFYKPENDVRLKSNTDAETEEEKSERYSRINGEKY